MAAGGLLKLRFGECEIDLPARRLTRSGRDVHLSPKAYELLKLLLETRPRAVSKHELLERIWQGVFVSDASLARVVNEVRHGIGDKARAPRLLRTVHAFGYAFSGDVTADTAAEPVKSSCWFEQDGRRLPLREGEQIIGREPDADIALDSPRVSRRHARLIVRGARASIEDLDSKNGTFLRGNRLDGAADLRPGEIVRIGPFTLTFCVAGAPGSTETDVIRK
jgi:DNA-binding winged helix-turn-helix (wHTH) protein